MRLAVLLFALTSLAPLSASAQDDVLGGPGLCQTSGCGGWLFFGAIVGTAALTVDTILIVEGIDKASQGHGLYAWGADFEIFWGAAHLVAAAGLLTQIPPDDRFGWLGMSIPLAVLGTYFIAHGALSLTSWRPPPPDDEEDEAESEPEPEPSAALSISPEWGGASVTLFGRF